MIKLPYRIQILTNKSDNMEKKASSLAIILHLLTAIILFFVIDQFIDNHPWIQASLFMIWGTFFFIDFLKILTKGRNGIGILGAYVLFYVGMSLIILFFIWAGNAILKLANPLFIVWGWEFHIGNLFQNIYNFAASLPSLICGLILATVALAWGDKTYSKNWFSPFLNGKSYNK